MQVHGYHIKGQTNSTFVITVIQHPTWTYGIWLDSPYSIHSIVSSHIKAYHKYCKRQKLMKIFTS